LIKTTRDIHGMNFEVIAESLAKSILDEMLKKVEFDKVDPAVMTVGEDESSDIMLDIANTYKVVNFQGNVSGSVIQIDDAEYKWEFEVTNLSGKDIKVSTWRPERKGYPDTEKISDPESLNKKALTLNFDAEEFSKRKKQILMKTIRFRIWWRNIGKKDEDFDPRNKFCLVTRKARLEDISSWF
jgi:hypothetical protein